MKKRNSLHWTGLVIGLFLLIQACVPSHYVGPLAVGEKGISATFGGPLITNFGPPIPIPFTSLGFGYGWKEKTTVFGDFHPTAASFGVIQVDAGVSHAFLKPNGAIPGVTVSPILNFGVDVWEGNARLWPEVAANAWWEYGQKKHYFYAGTSIWAELAGTKAHGEKQQQRLFPNFQIGHTLTGKKLDFNLELKYLNPVQSPAYITTVRYIPIGKQGAVGAYIGFTRKF